MAPTKLFSAVLVAAMVVAAMAEPRIIMVGEDEYHPTPVGYMRADCLREVPNGAKLFEDTVAELVHVTHPDGHREILPYCDTSDGARPIFLEQLGGPLPPSYDGWEEYTVVKTPKSYDAFLGYFSVPDMPKQDPEVLYLFTGLQNIDWIPKATPLPTQPFDIIQPVLQYPASWGNGWSVKSWWVTLNAGAFFSSELPVNVGDAIFGNMTRTAEQAYYIGSTIKSTGKITGLTYSNSRLATQPWGYNTVECYGCQSCATYPTKPSVFSQLDLFINEKPQTVDWVANQFPAAKHFCKESTDIVGSSKVVFNFA